MRALAVSLAAAVIGMLAAPVAAAPGTVDVRAAAGIGGGAQPATVSSYSGTVAPGASQNHYWNNAPVGTVYEVGLSPQGASTTMTCQFEVTRRWYVQTTTGSRQFWWTIKNVGTLACGANVLLTARSAGSSFAIGGLDPGASVTKVWNNLSAAVPVYVVGLSPTGATSTKGCSMEVTRTWQERVYTERKMWMTIKNSGTIACSATVLLSYAPHDLEIMTAVISPGQTYTSQWNNANPLTVAYWSTVSPRVQKFCTLEMTRQYWLQRVNSNGTTEREFHFSVKNIGSDDACDGGVLIDKIEA